jgi:hypothetical protein
VLLLTRSNRNRTAWLREALALRPDLRILEAPAEPTALDRPDRKPPAIVLVDLGHHLDVDKGIVRSFLEYVPDARLVLHAGDHDPGDATGGPGAERWLSSVLSSTGSVDGGAGVQARLTLREEPQSVPQARSFVTEVLIALGLDDYAEGVRLITTELVANAIRRRTGLCAVELMCTKALVRVAVADNDPELPKVQPLDPASECGRGLHLVSAFSSAWGVDSLTDGGKVVWAELVPEPSPLP